MKNLWLILASAVVVSCQTSEPIDYAVVSGKVSNLQGELYVYKINGSLKDTVAVNADGTFADTLRIVPGSYGLSDGKNSFSLYLDKGDNLVLNYDADNSLESAAISGIGAEENNYLLEKRKIDVEFKKATGNLYLLEEADFMHKVDSLKSLQEAKLAAAQGISEDFANLEKRNLNFEKLYPVSNYPTYHPYYTKKEGFEVSEGFLNEVKALSFDNEADFDYSTFYKALANGHYRELASEKVKQDSTLQSDIVFLEEVGKNPVEKIKNTLLNDAAPVYITFSKDPEAYYKTFMANSTNEEDKANLTTVFNKINALSAGNPSPKFMNYENHSGGTTSLDDLKGKYVYIDVWATWCGPCLREVPYLKELEADYHDKNIEFVSISIDVQKDYEKWKSMVDEKELKGVQLIADNNWGSQFVQDYLIKGIPRFILLDQEGNIISSSAARPSSKEIREQFESLNL